MQTGIERLQQINIDIGKAEQSVDPTHPSSPALAAARHYFDGVLSEQLIFRRASGKIVDKAAFIEGLANNPFESRELSDITVEFKDDRALVTLIVTGVMRSDHTKHRYRNIRLFSRAGDRWLLELWYNYEITGQ